jgi:anti-sigma regulatory factor (Ser/Thr protein kinase)
MVLYNLAVMTVRLLLGNDPAGFGDLAEFAEGFGREHGLPEDERARLMVILDELFSNAVNHGYEPGAAGRIEVVLSLDADRLTIEFADDGCPFDPLTSPPPDLDLPVEERPIGGLGLAIVRAFADDAVYRRDGDRNRLTLRRKLRRFGDQQQTIA